MWLRSSRMGQQTRPSAGPSKPRPLEITFGKETEAMNPVRQRLLFECHSIFCKTQSVALASKGELRVDDAMILSQRYRLSIRNAVRMADQMDLPQAQKQQIADELLSTEIIWSLFEAVSIRPTNHSIVVDLIEWGRECFSSAADVLATVMEEISCMQSNEKPERHELYWNALIQQVLSGDFKSASNLLKFHSKYETDGAFQKMAMIFQKIDTGLQRDRTNCDEFVEGQREIRELVQTGMLRQHDNLNFIYAILRGQKVAFMKCSQTLAINWYELLPAYVLFCHPAAKPHQIGKIAEDLFAFSEKSKDDLPVLDKTLFSILSLDCLEALRKICSCGSSSWWFATHLIDLLYYHDPSVLGNDIFSSSSQMGLRTRILVEYASSLFSTKELWEIAADYLMASGAEEVVQMLEERVSELDWQGNTQLAERIILMCGKYDW
uniref:Nuclear pore complex protein Nup85 n=1 Tax=Ditylenchus dipsaci TaxID=166011 RepID=A0A915CZS6_9BILA